jgi:16S rRNA (cytosine1402-N4)-methyltransferase
MVYRHTSVMTAEVLTFLNCRPGTIYADCTLGGSGHAKAILEKIIPDGLLIGIDQDQDAIINAEKVLAPYASSVRLFHDNFIHLPNILTHLDITGVDGILLDLGLSFYQLESSGRGFSFQKDEPLDMRMDVETRITAAELVNQLPEKELKRIFSEYGEERWAGRISRAIVEKRKTSQIKTSRHLSQIICESVPKGNRRIHPATRVFMALRIAVNQELHMLSIFLENVVNLLNPKGRLCVVSFHSLEDRAVKQQMNAFEKGCICPSDFPKCVCGKKKTGRHLTKRVIRPTPLEVTLNPMARSARLRVMERL